MTLFYFKQNLKGQEVENPKVDLKKSWYNLKSKPSLNEFLKDTSSIANTFGPDGFIILGIDEKEKKQYDANFNDSGLKDSNELIGIINKRIDRAFDINYYEELINNKKIGILHIPPSLDKPHVIKNYQTFHKDGKIKSEENHRIFVRSGTSTRFATKYDFELMVYDRKNIHPDYIIEVYLNEITFREIDQNKISAGGIINIENIGKRPISISDLILKFYFGNNEFIFNNAEAEMEFNSITSLIKIESRNIIVNPNRIFQKSIKVYLSDLGTAKLTEQFNENIKQVAKIVVEFQLNNGKKIIKDCNLMFK